VILEEAHVLYLLILRNPWQALNFIQAALSNKVQVLQNIMSALYCFFFIQFDPIIENNF